MLVIYLQQNTPYFEERFTSRSCEKAKVLKVFILFLIFMYSHVVELNPVGCMVCHILLARHFVVKTAIFLSLSVAIAKTH